MSTNGMRRAMEHVRSIVGEPVNRTVPANKSANQKFFALYFFIS